MTKKVLVLGPDSGWHASQLRESAEARGFVIHWSRYETLRASLLPSLLPSSVHDAYCLLSHNQEPASLFAYDYVLARTMPVGSLEQITLRLNILHSLVAAGRKVVNCPDALEVAIDKYRTLARVAALGFPVPATVVVQDRVAALDAFDRLGGDVVVKPLFGGEGRGVMRVRDRELAWTTFTTLERLDAVIYVQAFVKPGGIDNRLLVIGRQVFGVCRTAGDGWKTNVAQGGASTPFVPLPWQRELALAVAADLKLTIGAVDLLECEDGSSKVVEVNAVPGWKGAQEALGIDLAGEMLDCLGN